MDDPQPNPWLPLFCAWLLALIATLGVLFVGEVMGQACLLYTSDAADE